METLKDHEYEMIKTYKKTKDENIALYFYDKFKIDVTQIIYWKINKKFSSIPFEKGDLFHLVWNSIKKTLEEYKKKTNFNAVLVKNCYYLTLKELRKFLNNSELVMNISGSFDGYSERIKHKTSSNAITKFEMPQKMLLENLIESVCGYITKYSQPTVKRVIYLKSQGYSVADISKKLRISRYYINSLLQTIEKIVKKMYF